MFYVLDQHKDLSIIKTLSIQDKTCLQLHLGVPYITRMFNATKPEIERTTGLLPSSVIHFLIAASVFLMSIAMAGLGLSINMTDFKKVGRNTIVMAIVGFVALTILGQVLITVFY